MSKHLNLRLPDDLHAVVKAAADRDRRSLNSMLVVLIERGLATGRPASPPP
jgi:predicted HicB family RNase H-like nuclease